MQNPLDSVHFRQLIKFSIVGAANTIIDFSVYFVLTRYAQTPFLLASTISWLLAVTSSFTFNKFWTFRVRGMQGIRTQYVKFFLVSVVSLAVSLFTLWLLVAQFGIHDLLAKIVTIGIVVFWNFFMNKFWTFKRRHDGY
ncbi:MAG: GtrA family protein [Candidatus Komeilibacteria bacterium]|nr:GtrA family protein [Candidatus Komeilibacteria bacterium]